MTPSAKCADLIKSYENCRLIAYLPTVNDVLTIGWGHTGPEVHDGLRWTQEHADEQFEADLDHFSVRVTSAIDDAPTTQGQFDAMVSLAFNIGVDAFKTSTLLRLHRTGDLIGAADQFKRWNRQAGKVLRGLTRRRASEAAMYRGIA